MQCTECKKGDTKVIDSRDDQKTIRRRRECLKCGFRFTTYEKIEIPAIKIEKRDELKIIKRKKFVTEF